MDMPQKNKFVDPYSQLDSTYRLKILVLGPSGAGKTSFIQRFVKKTFHPIRTSTLTFDFERKTLKFNDFTLVHLNIWDTAGMERFAPLTPSYYRDAVGALVLFDVSEAITNETLKTLNEKKSDLDSICNFKDGSKIPSILVGNKCELLGDKTDAKLELIKKDSSFDSFLCASAKEDINVDEAFHDLVKKIMTQSHLLERNDFSTSPKIKVQESESAGKLGPARCRCWIRSKHRDE